MVGLFTTRYCEALMASVRRGVESSENLKSAFGELDGAVNRIVQLADEMGRTDVMEEAHAGVS